MWKKKIVCKFCKHDFVVTDLDVNYGDCKSPIFFLPDYQYFLSCPLCSEQLIIHDIPSDIALEIQARVVGETNGES